MTSLPSFYTVRWGTALAWLESAVLGVLLQRLWFENFWQSQCHAEACFNQQDQLHSLYGDWRQKVLFTFPLPKAKSFSFDSFGRVESHGNVVGTILILTTTQFGFLCPPLLFCGGADLFCALWEERESLCLPVVSHGGGILTSSGCSWIENLVFVIT